MGFLGGGVGIGSRLYQALRAEPRKLHKTDLSASSLKSLHVCHKTAMSGRKGTGQNSVSPETTETSGVSKRQTKRNAMDSFYQVKNQCLLVKMWIQPSRDQEKKNIF